MADSDPKETFIHPPQSSLHAPKPNASSGLTAPPAATFSTCV